MNLEPWRPVVLEAAGKLTIAVKGTTFRSMIDRAAEQHQLRFPPPEEIRFAAFLASFQDLVSVIRRPGQDFLVVPTGREAWASAEPPARAYGVREDFFRAFTTFGQYVPYYEKRHDRVTWVASATTMTDDLIPIPPTTLEAQVKVRSDFVETISDRPTVADALAEALKSPFPLAEFGKKARELGAQSAWHSFRVDRIIREMQQWAKDSGLDWKDAWLAYGGRPFREQLRTESPASPFTTASVVQSFGELLDGLEPADIQRISVPLDLVLKAFAARK